MSNAASDFLRENGGSSHPGVAFPNVGDIIIGAIAEEARVVETEFDGKLSKSLVIPVVVRAGSSASTGQRNAYVPVQAGEIVSVWVKAGSMARALLEATKGTPGVQEGGVIAMKYIGDGDPKPGKNPAKLYAAEYVAPTPAVSLSALLPTSPNTTTTGSTATLTYAPAPQSNVTATSLLG